MLLYASSLRTVLELTTRRRRRAMFRVGVVCAPDFTSDPRAPITSKPKHSRTSVPIDRWAQSYKAIRRLPASASGTKSFLQDAREVFWRNIPLKSVARAGTPNAQKRCKRTLSRVQIAPLYRFSCRPNRHGLAPGPIRPRSARTDRDGSSDAPWHMHHRVVRYTIQQLEEQRERLRTRLALFRWNSSDLRREPCMSSGINRSVFDLGTRGVLAKEIVALPVLGRSDGSRNKTAAAIRADVSENIIDARCAECAFVGADACFKRGGW